MWRRSSRIAANSKRERNRDGDDQRAAHVAEEQEEDERDQQDAFGQVAQHGVRRVVHQVAAVEVRNDLDSGGQQASLPLMPFS